MGGLGLGRSADYRAHPKRASVWHAVNPKSAEAGGLFIVPPPPPPPPLKPSQGRPPILGSASAVERSARPRKAAEPATLEAVAKQGGGGGAYFPKVKGKKALKRMEEGLVGQKMDL